MHELLEAYLDDQRDGPPVAVGHAMIEAEMAELRAGYEGTES